MCVRVCVCGAEGTSAAPALLRYSRPVAPRPGFQADATMTQAIVEMGFTQVGMLTFWTGGFSRPPPFPFLLYFNSFFTALPYFV